ncbi:cystathionine beta-lyase [Thalassotalea insulae]|uniref:Cystathionine beta-lyase n=1 Tax=Thalassotalea insulae TaxID=2056778 RepID=A0ABQ6GVQ3_9GAMM|nr:PLP-dependent aspartate aminotransferase family protein [Thalassotalea insulae]GLX78261.1 cystathionine beta-lyase [Thalassotalea insulae]
MNNISTKLIHQGREQATASFSVNPPLVRASTTVFPDLASYKASYQGLAFETPRYGRSGTSTVMEFQSAMAAISNAESCIATSCGLTACLSVLAAYAKPGRQILIQRDVYGPVKAFADSELAQLGVEVEYFANEQELDSLIDNHTSLIYTEVPTSLTMKLIDIKKISAIAKSHQVPHACDATWGTPVFFDAHRFGINLAIHAATKYINGHSDVLLGAITGSYQDLQLVRDYCQLHGNYAAPDSCWLALRGLRTLSVRLARHQQNALYIASWLKAQPQVQQLLFPALPESPDYQLWQQLFSGAAGPFSIELVPCDDKQFERFINSLTLFGIGTSWGGFESLIMPAVPHHLRATTTQKHQKRLVRLHIGLEDKQDLCDDLQRAFKTLAK